MPGQMFLRTAQTEQRITDLEERMALVLERLGMTPKPQTDEEWEAAAPVVEPVAKPDDDDAPIRGPKKRARG